MRQAQLGPGFRAVEQPAREMPVRLAPWLCRRKQRGREGFATNREGGYTRTLPRPARLRLRKESGGAAEVLLLAPAGPDGSGRDALQPQTPWRLMRL